MSSEFESRINAARRLSESRQGREGPSAAEDADGQEVELVEGSDAFSILSADRQQKVMVEFRLLNGNAKALAYSYLVAVDFDPSQSIRLDFSGYTVAINGRNLRPLFVGLVAQRVAVIREMDVLQAEASTPPDSTVVTSIKISEVE